MEAERKMEDIGEYRVSVVVKTGLHIGGTKDVVSVGGVDNKVIRSYTSDNNKNKRVPIIPGSSLKGKIRGLLELKYRWHINGNPLSKADDIKEKINSIGEKNERDKLIAFLKVFGTQPLKDGDISLGEDKKINLGIGRALFEDLYPTRKTIQMWEEKDLVDYVEIKTENTINRISGKASNPRSTERVIPGSVFEGTIRLCIITDDDKEYLEEMKNILYEGIELLNNSYLGGSGTRGYGRVEVKLEKCRDNKEE